MNIHGVTQVERLFVFGGAYGNLQATIAMFAEASRLGFRPEEILFTGDAVAYCGEPQATVDLIRGSGIHVIAGNCETSLAAGADDCGCGFEDGSACSVLSDQWYRFCRENLSAEAISWMGSLPLTKKFDLQGFRLLACHGTPSSINQFVFESDLENERFIQAKLEQVDCIICGHSGIPFLSEVAEMAWVNSGAAGMPANDGSPRVWYAIIEARNNQLSAALHSLDYDFGAAAAAMDKHGLNNGYRDCLQTGFWPSHDVLPQQEKARTGHALASSVRKYANLKKPELA